MPIPRPTSLPRTPLNNAESIRQWIDKLILTALDQPIALNSQMAAAYRQGVPVTAMAKALGVSPRTLRVTIDIQISGEEQEARWERAERRVRATPTVKEFIEGSAPE
jgi:hypothetical protein